jgi:hypothetical protein
MTPGTIEQLIKHETTNMLLTSIELENSNQSSPQFAKETGMTAVGSLDAGSIDYVDYVDQQQSSNIKFYQEDE